MSKSESHYKKSLENLVSLMYKSQVKYKNDIDLIDKIISIYAIIKKENKKNDNRILPYEKAVLAYYILHGFNKESKELVMEALKKNENQVNTTNSNLRKKGYLYKDTRNKTKGYVNKELQDMAEAFLRDKNKVLVTVFKK